jgi:predicted amidohydrolase YtcJ
VLVRMDGHMVLANSEALRLAGIGSATADPEDGAIDRDGLGQPTGILRCVTALAVVMLTRWSVETARQCQPQVQQRMSVSCC